MCIWAKYIQQERFIWYIWMTNSSYALECPQQLIQSLPSSPVTTKEEYPHRSRNQGWLQAHHPHWVFQLENVIPDPTQSFTHSVSSTNTCLLIWCVGLMVPQVISFTEPDAHGFPEDNKFSFLVKSIRVQLKNEIIYILAPGILPNTPSHYLP